jgi:hypothetical protein
MGQAMVSPPNRSGNTLQSLTSQGHGDIPPNRLHLLHIPNMGDMALVRSYSIDRSPEITSPIQVSLSLL